MTLKMPLWYLFALYMLSLFAVLFLPALFFDLKIALAVGICSLAIYLTIMEILFRKAYHLITKRPYQFIPKMRFKQIYIEPHPYLPYVYKKRFLCQKTMPSTLPLNREKGYMLSELRSNNFRHFNGQTGDRDIIVPKPKGMIRINCLGASTTASYIFYKDRNYSYPMELENILCRAFPDKTTEVNNCGQGGYTSAEILIKFLLDSIDTEPDMIVLYHACNDLRASLTDNFESDYSHSRKNLGEVWHLYRLASYMPNLPLASWNLMVNYCLFSQNVRYSIPDVITRGKPNIKNNFMGLPTYRRNIEHLIDICRARGIKVVLSTYCHYLYDAIKDNEWHLKYREGIKLENEAMRTIAGKYNLPLVDNDLIFPREEKYFMDSVHFSHEGMMLLAKNISEPIIDYIKML